MGLACVKPRVNVWDETQLDKQVGDFKSSRTLWSRIVSQACLVVLELSGGGTPYLAQAVKLVQEIWTGVGSVSPSKCANARPVSEPNSPGLVRPLQGTLLWCSDLQ